MNLKWTVVSSSAIGAIAYDRKNKKLYIQFNHGGIYSYENIGYHRYVQLKKADSVGKYYNQAIRPRKVA